jgi:hypothetical protein
MFFKTYSDANVHYNVSTNQAVAHIARLRTIRFLGKGNGSIDQEGLAEIESNQAGPGRYHRKNRPLELVQCYREK